MKPRRKQTETMRAWVLEYLREQTRKYGDGAAVDVCNRPFHDAFYARFGGAVVPKCYGAQPVKKAMRLLREMAKEGLLVTGRIGIDKRAGLPTWVILYGLPRPESSGEKS